MTKDALMGIIISMSLGLASFSLKWVWDANSEIKLLEERISQIQEDHRTDENQDKQIRMLWRYSSWAEEQIAEIRDKNQMRPASKPKWEN